MTVDIDINELPPHRLINIRKFSVSLSWSNYRHCFSAQQTEVLFLYMGQITRLLNAIDRKHRSSQRARHRRLTDIVQVA